MQPLMSCPNAGLAKINARQKTPKNTNRRMDIMFSA